MSTHEEAREFEAQVRRTFAERYSTELQEREVTGVGKRFDFVSPDNSVIGDAKYYAMVRGQSVPPAKFSVIAEHVWLLEKTGAKDKFLVFGNDIRVPQIWLKKYGNLVEGIKFYFQEDSGRVTIMN